MYVLSGLKGLFASITRHFGKKELKYKRIENNHQYVSQYITSRPITRSMTSVSNDKPIITSRAITRSMTNVSNNKLIITSRPITRSMTNVSNDKLNITSRPITRSMTKKN